MFIFYSVPILLNNSNSNRLCKMMGMPCNAHDIHALLHSMPILSTMSI